MAVSQPASGYVFYPTDEEILDTFLKKKLQHQPLPSDRIKEADVYGTHPSNLTDQFERSNRLSQWFFFTWTTRKHPDATNSTRASRVAGQGRWKSTQSVKLVRNGKGQVVGSKQNFCYMEHPTAGKEVKTMWLMEEYSIQSLRTRGGVAVSKDQNKLDDWVVCKIYLRPKARKEPSSMKVAARETRNLEWPKTANQPFITQVQESLNCQLADDTLPPLIEASDQEMVSFQAPYGVFQRPAPQNMDGNFGSLHHEQPAGTSNEGLDYASQHDVASLPVIRHLFYHEQPAGAPNEGLDYAPQHDVASLPEIPYLFCHEQPASASTEGLDYAPQHDIMSLPEILHPFHQEQLAGAPDEGLDFVPTGTEQLDLASVPEILPPPDISFPSVDEILKQFDDAPDEAPVSIEEHDMTGPSPSRLLDYKLQAALPSSSQAGS